MIVKDRGETTIRCDAAGCPSEVGASFGSTGLVKSMARDSGWAVDDGKHFCAAHNPKSIRR